MDELLLHASTRSAVERYLANPTHALLLSAPEGSGKLILGQQLAAILAHTSSEQLAEHPYAKIIVPAKDKTSISIEAIRDLQQFTKLKLPKADARRVILIPNAELMLQEAQNALLKLLEEPPEGTYFVLTTSNERQLLATIRSRVQVVEVRRPSYQASTEYFTTLGFAEKDVQQALRMSGGLVGLMHALLSDSDHPLKGSVETARTLLQATSFERLCKVEELSKQKTQARNVLFMMGQMATAAIGQATSDQVIARWRSILQASYEAEEALAQNASAKLTLTNFMLSL